MSEFHLILVNFVVAGLEIAASVAFTFIPPLLLKSGYTETQMTIIFGIGEICLGFKKTGSGGGEGVACLLMETAVADSIPDVD